MPGTTLPLQDTFSSSDHLYDPVPISRPSSTIETLLWPRCQRSEFGLVPSNRCVITPGHISFTSFRECLRGTMSQLCCSQLMSATPSANNPDTCLTHALVHMWTCSILIFHAHIRMQLTVSVSRHLEQIASVVRV